jgi:RNA polymerase sigma-70 factor (ECF subfamily)
VRAAHPGDDSTLPDGDSDHGGARGRIWSTDESAIRTELFGPSGILLTMPPGKIVPLARAFARGDTPADPRPLAELDDDELMLLVRGGRGTAFDELVRRHQRRLLGVAARYVRDPSLARDLVQSTFLELYRAAGRYQPQGVFTSFLYRILLNQCRMARRAARSDERRRTAAALELTDESDPQTSEARILARERERDVQRALDRLSEKLRAVIVLRYSAELSYQDIADILATPLGTIKRRLFDALDQLRQVLGEKP